MSAERCRWCGDAVPPCSPTRCVMRRRVTLPEPTPPMGETTRPEPSEPGRVPDAMIDAIMRRVHDDHAGGWVTEARYGAVLCYAIKALRRDRERLTAERDEARETLTRLRALLPHVRVDALRDNDGEAADNLCDLIRASGPNPHGGDDE